MKGAVYWVFRFIEWFKVDVLRRSNCQFLTVFLCYSIKDYIFLAVLFAEGVAQGTQRKEVIIAFFAKHLKSFMTEVTILLKPVHWFAEQTNGFIILW